MHLAGAEGVVERAEGAGRADLGAVGGNAGLTAADSRAGDREEKRIVFSLTDGHLRVIIPKLHDYVCFDVFYSCKIGTLTN
jgi:hypothetical protein